MSIKNRIGKHVETSTMGESHSAYVPKPLPPDPPLNMDGLDRLHHDAVSILSELRGKASLLPDINFFLYGYIRKEAVLSSQIEGTQSSLSDLMQHEQGSKARVSMDDIQEVSCYVKAMDYGFEEIENLSLSLRFMRNVHRKLMDNARGGERNPGEFRSTQNWIGGTRPSNATFVPPPVPEMNACMHDFEAYLNEESVTLPLIKAALAHVQFETIHPFLDGNGRLGRLLIMFILYDEDVLKYPLLYLSLYFKLHRQEYYDRLQSVREKGDWEGWVKFFLEAVVHTGNETLKDMDDILALFEQDEKTMQTLGKATEGVMKVYNCLKKKPVMRARGIEEDSGLSFPAVNRSLGVLMDLGIVKEISGKQKGRIFAYSKYLDILSKDTEPLP